MDLLRSFNLDELPEQQTRTRHLEEAFPDFDMSLGFDSCCSCGKRLGGNCPPVRCLNCRRVSYCSDQCRHSDSNVPLPSSENIEEEGETALGHTSVICAILKTCAEDEAVEMGESSQLETSKLQAAEDRIRSEKESYPATLSNVIAEGPCFAKKLRECAARRKLVLHVVGASLEAELWETTENNRSFADAYADSLTELAMKYQFDMIELLFIGPECPTPTDLRLSRRMESLDRDQPTSDLNIQTLCASYREEILKENSLPSADIVVFFNPGFTVPEYDWRESISSIEKGTPFLSTTNTELEGIADCQFLMEQDKIQSIPPGLADMFGVYCGDDDRIESNSTAGSSFFSENPFCGSRVRQNGTMANDLFVKNHWILGGIIDSYSPSSGQQEPGPKRRKNGESLNSKKDNPALV